MKFKRLFFYVICFSFTSLAIAGCKSNQGIIPSNPEVATLKGYYAKVANVDISKVKYNTTDDNFSINGHFVISYKSLMSHYKTSLTGRIQN